MPYIAGFNIVPQNSGPADPTRLHFSDIRGKQGSAYQAVAVLLLCSH